VNAVPKQALTVGVATVCEARQVMLMATGYAKANALKHTIEGDVLHVKHPGRPECFLCGITGRRG